MGIRLLKNTAPATEPAEISDREYWRQEKEKAIWDLLIFFAAVVIVAIAVGTAAWFASNKEVSGSGMAVNAQAMSFTIQTRDGIGYYSSVYESLETGEMEWKVSSDSNFNNHSAAVKTNETEPRLEPGDHGSLEFRVNPNNANSITVDCFFDVKAYLETETTDENGKKAVTITEIEDEVLVGYVKAHIMLFSGYDPATHKYTGLIDTDASLRRVLADQTYAKDGTDYTKIYWIWPEHLGELTDSNDGNRIYASSEKGAVIAYIAKNKDGFFKNCNDSMAQVASDLTTLSTSYSGTIYNHYNMKYDNADLDIGNNISYVMLSMQVEEK